MEGFAACPLPSVFKVQASFLGGVRPQLRRDFIGVHAIWRTWVRPALNPFAKDTLGWSLLNQPDCLKDTDVTTACGQAVWMHGCVLATQCLPERVVTLLGLPQKRFPQGRYVAGSILFRSLFYFFRVRYLSLQ